MLLSGKAGGAAGQPAEGEQRLTDGAGGSVHEHALASLYPCRAVEELVCGRPGQDENLQVERQLRPGWALRPLRPGMHAEEALAGAS